MIVERLWCVDIDCLVFCGCVIRWLLVAVVDCGVVCLLLRLLLDLGARFGFGLVCSWLL